MTAQAPAQGAASTTSEPRKHKAVFLTGGLVAHILRMGLSAYAALFFVQLADVLALLYIAQIEPVESVAGLGVAMTLFMLVFVVNIGFSMGVSALVGKSVVVDPGDLMTRKLTSAIITFTAVAFVASMVFLALVPQLCSLLGMTGASRAVAERYLTILAPVTAVQALSMGCAAAMRGLGRARDGMLVTMVGAMANLIVDPIFILLMGMGVDGAAYGVWVGRIVQVLVGITLLLRSGLLTPVTPKHIADTLRPLLMIAIPATVAAAAAPVGAALLMAIVSDFGDTARSSIFLVDRMASFIFGFAIPLGPAMGGIIAQNYAAHQLDRCLAAFKIFAALVAGYVVTGSVGLMLFQEHLLRFYNVVDPESLRLTRFYLGLVGIAWVAQALIGGSSVIFQNTDRAKYSAYINWTRVVLGMAPCWFAANALNSAEAAIGGYIIGLTVCGIFAAGFATSVLLRERGKVLPVAA